MVVIYGIEKGLCMSSASHLEDYYDYLTQGAVVGKCKVCEIPLRGTSFVEKDGTLFCHPCFGQKTAVEQKVVVVQFSPPAVPVQ